jgi:hypothetical protein
MIKVTLNVLVFAVLISTNDVHAWSLFGPRNYEDCILKEMQGEPELALLRSLCLDLC